MKNILYTVIALALLAGCSKSPAKPDNTNTASIAGKWFYTTDTVNVYTNGTLQSSKAYNYNRLYYLQFNSDGTGLKQTDTLVNFTYSLTGQILILTLPAPKTSGFIKPQSIGTDGVTQPTVNVTGDIKLLNSTNLAIYFPQESVTNGGNTVTSESAYFTK